MRRLIRGGELAAEPIGARGYQIWPQAVDAYQRTRGGGQGWDKRKAADYTPGMGQRTTDRLNALGRNHHPTIAGANR